MPVARKMTEVHGKTEEYLGTVVYVWCPGCELVHAPCIEKGNEDRPVWSFNGDYEKPTFSPSILVTWGQTNTCHSFITDGVWNFLNDSTHKLAGKQVPVVELPDWLQK